MHLLTLWDELGDYSSSLRVKHAILEASQVQAGYGDTPQQRTPVDLRTDLSQHRHVLLYQTMLPLNKRVHLVVCSCMSPEYGLPSSVPVHQGLPSGFQLPASLQSRWADSGLGSRGASPLLCP